MAVVDTFFLLCFSVQLRNISPRYNPVCDSDGLLFLIPQTFKLKEDHVYIYLYDDDCIVINYNNNRLCISGV